MSFCLPCIDGFIGLLDRCFGSKRPPTRFRRERAPTPILQGAESEEEVVVDSKDDWITVEPDSIPNAGPVEN